MAGPALREIVIVLHHQSTGRTLLTMMIWLFALYCARL
jgi:hypothetical protein